MSGKPSARSACIEMSFFTDSPRVSSITSRIPALMSKHSFRGGAFLMSAADSPDDLACSIPLP